MTKTLFDVLVAGDKLHAGFRHLMVDAPSLPARLMADDVYQDFVDPDGNFLEQFQTSGFDARFFELYLHAYFSRSGFEVQRPSLHPDFIISRDGLSAAVEATTINRAMGGPFFGQEKDFAATTEHQLRQYEQDEPPIRFGSPLYSKLERRDWELPQCEGLPFVIAIEAFHQEGSLFFSDAALQRYLFGEEYSADWDKTGKLQIRSAPVVEHKIGAKSIASRFFDQLDTSNISAILFTNSGTHAKFSRMGYQTGLGCDQIEIWRTGYGYDFAPDAMDPALFFYSMDCAPVIESWAQGLVLFHNPNALRPLPRDFFAGAVQSYVEDDTFKSDLAGWHPFVSHTTVIDLGTPKANIPEFLRQRAPVIIQSISQEQFRAIAINPPPDNRILEEKGWFSDGAGGFLGVVVRDKIDNDWGYVVLARDQHFIFRAIDVHTSLASRAQAREQVQYRIMELLKAPQRIFPRGDATE